MYLANRGQQKASITRVLLGRVRASRNVWFLGLTSLFTDVSSEMVASVLPAYLVLQLGLSPLAFGAVDGLYQGIGSLVRWIGGASADRTHRPKELAAAGYGLSALCRIGLLLVGSAWTAITALIAIDRIGKGFRTAPRDALIAASTPAAELGTAFGVHRALDAVGALSGPLVAFVVLSASPRAYDLVFVISFSFAMVGLAFILLFVENVPPSAAPAKARPLATVAAPFRRAEFSRLLLIACALALATVSDAFVYLVLQRGARFGPQIFPLLAAATAVSYVVLAIPAGRTADVVGRATTFVAGHVALLAVYAILWRSPVELTTVAVCVLLLGSYYAMTDGVLAAAASAILDPESRGSGLALLGTAVSLSRLAASVAFGWIWTRYGPAVAVNVFGTALVAAILLAMTSRRRLEKAT